MMRALLLFLLCAQAQACIVGDRSSVNKSIHLVGEAAITIVVSERTDSLAWGIGTALAVGAYREVWKKQHGYECEYSSMVYDLAGIAAGVAVRHWTIVPTPGGVEVTYSKEF